MFAGACVRQSSQWKLSRPASLQVVKTLQSPKRQSTGHGCSLQISWQRQITASQLSQPRSMTWRWAKHGPGMPTGPHPPLIHHIPHHHVMATPKWCDFVWLFLVPSTTCTLPREIQYNNARSCKLCLQAKDFYWLWRQASQHDPLSGPPPQVVVQASKSVHWPHWQSTGHGWALQASHI